MQIDVTRENMELIVRGLELVNSTESDCLAFEMREHIEQALELEGLELDDCAGGACKL